MTTQNDWATWRQTVAPWHPTPEPAAALLYLASEVGEACDAFLRLHRPHDDRSYPRQRDLARELAQIIDMTYAVAIGLRLDLDAAIRAWQAEVRGRGVTAT